MFDPRFVREHVAELEETIRRQKKPELVTVLEDFLKHDQEWRKLKGEADALRSSRNKLSEEINATKKRGGDIAPILKKVKAIPDKIKKIEERMDALFVTEMRPRLAKLPNIMHKDVPYGKDDSENPERKKWGKARTFTFPIKNHVELCEQNDWADFEASAKTTGNGFYFLKGDLALLNQALIRFALDRMVAAGYTYIEPPLMVRLSVLEAAMDMAAIQQSVYKVEGEQTKDEKTATDRVVATSEANQLRLIGTAEHALLGMHAGDTFKAEELPKKYVGYSMCFRQEIGSHGINEKGLWRTHQFNKVEQFIYCLPEQSWQLYDELLANSEGILQALELPYRVVEICTGDLAAWKSRSHDVEVWRPTTEAYGEVMSLSNCTTYQATDIEIRYVKKDGERGVVHTLNNTALATSRVMVAILENYQEQDGTVTIPKVLRPYMGEKEKLLPTK